MKTNIATSPVDFNMYMSVRMCIDKVLYTRINQLYFCGDDQLVLVLV